MGILPLQTVLKPVYNSNHAVCLRTYFQSKLFSKESLHLRDSSAQMPEYTNHTLFLSQSDQTDLIVLGSYFHRVELFFFEFNTKSDL